MPCLLFCSLAFPLNTSHYTIILLRLDPERSFGAVLSASSVVVENLRDAVDRRLLLLVLVDSETSLTCGDELVNS